MPDLEDVIDMIMKFNQPDVVLEKGLFTVFRQAQLEEDVAEAEAMTKTQDKSLFSNNNSSIHSQSMINDKDTNFNEASDQIKRLKLREMFQHRQIS